MIATTLLICVLALGCGFALGVWFAGRRPSTHASGLASTSARQAVAPVEASLERFEARLRDMETHRAESAARLREQVESVRHAGESLRRETGALATALSRPQQRGAWGELQLQRTAELAGMLQYCDFDVQVSVQGDDATLRPDMLVNLAGGRHIVIDAKAPLDSYLQAAATDDATEAGAHLNDHAERLRTHIRQLASKRYWEQFDDAPELVVLFVPGESFLSAALQARPDLTEFAARHNVVLATPMSLIALLRTAALGWSHERLAADARDIHRLATEFLKRADTVGEHLGSLGQTLGQAVGHYNRTIGSFEARLLPTVRRLGADDASGPEFGEKVAAEPREMTAPELRRDIG